MRMSWLASCRPTGGHIGYPKRDASQPDFDPIKTGGGEITEASPSNFAVGLVSLKLAKSQIDTLS